MSLVSAGQPPGESRALWERRAEESDAAFACFVVYRDQAPPRSIKRVAASLERDKTILEDWSSKYAWVERASAYTDHLDRLVMDAHEDDLVRRRREVNAQIAETAQALHFGAMARLYGSEDPERPVAAIDLNALDQDDIVRWFDSGAKWGRLALGLPDVTGAQVITVGDLQFIIRSVIGVAERRMVRADFEAFVRECRTLIQERLGA